MNLYTKTYQSANGPLELTDYIRHPQFGNYMIGNTAEGGFITQLDEDDNEVKKTVYTLPNERLFFKKIAINSIGKLFVLGYTKSGNFYSPYILKLDNQGALIIAKKVNISEVTSIIKIGFLPTDEILIFGDIQDSKPNFFHSPFVLKIAKDIAKIINAKLIKPHHTHRINSAIIGTDSIVIFTYAKSLSLQHYVQLNLDLSLVHGKFIIKNDIIELSSDIDKNNNIYLIGNYTSSNELIIGEGKLKSDGIEIISSHKLDLGSPRKVKGIKKTSNGLFVILNDENKQSYLTRFNPDFTISHSVTVDNGEKASFSRIIEDDNNLYVSGNKIIDSNKIPLIIKSNFQLENYKLQNPKNVNSAVYKIGFSNEVPVKIENLGGGLEIVKLLSSSETIKDEESPEISFQLKEPYKIQSDSINLQAAGSIGNDSTAGNHLRWFLNGYLGDNHIPKGDYATNTNYFNRKEDYVKIYRIPYQSEQAGLSLNIFGEVPSNIHNVDRVWTYTVNNKFFYLHFADESKYKQLLNSLNPKTKSLDFLSGYGQSLLELTQKEDLAFALTFKSANNTEIKLETFSISNKEYDGDELVISSRKVLKQQSSHRIEVENIHTIRFSIQQGSIGSIIFENYSDYLMGAIEEDTIETVGEYSISIDDSIVLNQLEDPEQFRVHNHWKKYNESAKVNIENYYDRWTKFDGLMVGVAEYLQYSNTDPQALKIYKEELVDGDESKIEISLQKFLNVAALDFHVARMLGMGTIDIKAASTTPRKFIYLMEYITEKDVTNYEKSKFCQHLYLSLPTSTLDERLPLPIHLEPISYGLEVDNATDKPLKLTDEKGYAPYIQTRYAKIKARSIKDYALSQTFFSPGFEFLNSNFSSPVFYGIENKVSTESNWRKPEITHNSVYKDTQGQLETQGVLFNEENEKADYIHAITEEGIGEYAIYPINIFSRAGELSNIQQTDFTKFVKPNTLQPPTNIRAQLIQKENPLLLTTNREQELLSRVTARDQEGIFCRVDFDYPYTHDEQYQFGNKVRLYFRREMPRNIIGSITAVKEHTDDPSICTLSTGKFYYKSTGEEVTPSIMSLQFPNFENAILTYRNKNYRVKSLILTNLDHSNPQLVVKKIEKREAQHIENNQNQLQQIYEPIIIDEHEPFLLVENLANPISWNRVGNSTLNKFSFDIDLGNETWQEKTETHTDAEGNSTQKTTKGIWEKIKITKIEDHPNLYNIEFNNFKLDYHPQNNPIPRNTTNFSVSWHGGQIRIPLNNSATNNSERKILDVLTIKHENNLKLTVIDRNFDSTNDSNNIIIGNSILANYHPGYRVYLKKEDNILFNKTNLFPIENEGTRYSILGLQTIDTNTLDANSKPYESPVSVPATIFAREIIIPLQPEQPIGPLYATPPDYYNKATYSFTTTFKHKPWGLVYYRIAANSILTTLYTKETLDKIRVQLPPTPFDEHLEERWADLLSFDYEDNDGDFKTFPIHPESETTFKFPMPDREFFGKELANKKPQDIKDLIQEAIYANLLPLTEQPLIVQHIKNGTYIPQPKKQVIKDRSGKVLHPSDPLFDQAPMAKKFEDGKVLFTDFTLDSNMHSSTAYFYVVREMSNSMKLGAPSEFLGPVQLLNTNPPEKMTVKRVVAPLPSDFNGYSTTVQFTIDKIPYHQDISKIEILRATNSLDALSVRTMKIVKSIPLISLYSEVNTLQFEDDFSDDVDNIPYGIPLYYRLRGVKEIFYKNHKGVDKQLTVYSKPTKIFLTNVVDLNSPKPPSLSLVEKLMSNSNPKLISTLKLKCEKVCFNGIYRLQYLNEANTWEILDTITSNDPTELVFEIQRDFPTEDEDEEKIYHKFKVEVQNSAGILNKSDNIFVV